MSFWKQKTFFTVLLTASAASHALSAWADPYYVNEQWALFNPLNALGAWKINNDCRGIKVAVIDSGVDGSHPDLKDSIIGHVDLIKNAAALSEPEDDFSHGTAVAGIIAAKGLGVYGVCHQAQILSIKTVDHEGNGDEFDLMRAVRLANDHKAKVINLSITSTPITHARRAKAFADTLEKSPALFVVAAGNESANNDVVQSFPASLSFSNMIVVSASTFEDQLSRYSNYGVMTSNIAAPGDRIFTTFPTHATRYMAEHNVDTNYALFNGTSAAAPFVSGAAALYWNQHPALTASQVRDRILSTADSLPALQGKISSGGRLNLSSLMHSE